MPEQTIISTLEGVTEVLNDTMKEIIDTGTIKDKKLHLKASNVTAILKSRGFVNAFNLETSQSPVLNKEIQEQ